jgi:Cupin-like domain
MDSKELSLTSPAPRSSAAEPYTALDESWQQWVAENRLRNCTPQSMLQTMSRAGLDPERALAAISAIETNPVFLAARKHQQLLRKLESVVANQQKLWESDPHYMRVEKRPDMPLDEFVTRHVRGSRPVVLTGLTQDWPAMQRWSPQDLKDRFGHLEIEIQAERSADPHYEQNKLKHRRRQNLGAFVDQVLAGGPTNDYYMTANNEVLRQAEFAPLLKDIGTLPAACDATQLSRASSFWFGPAGTVTPLHHDTLMLFHTQVVGRKRWRFISPFETPHLYNFNQVFSPINVDQPDLVRYPDFAKVKMLEVIVEPGETVFLPLGWWHQVTSLDVSLSFSYSNLAVPNQFTYTHAEIHNW